MSGKQKTPTGKKMGRPKLDIDFAMLNKLCEFQCTEAEIASWFDISIATLERRITEQTQMTFVEYYEQKRGKGHISLRRKQWQVALGGNPTMLIWLGKQYLVQRDKQELEHSGSVGTAPCLDLRALTKEERAQLEALVEKAEGGPDGKGSSG